MTYKLDELKNQITNPESKETTLVSRFNCKGKHFLDIDLEEKTPPAEELLSPKLKI